MSRAHRHNPPATLSHSLRRSKGRAAARAARDRQHPRPAYRPYIPLPTVWTSFLGHPLYTLFIRLDIVLRRSGGAPPSPAAAWLRCHISIPNFTAFGEFSSYTRSLSTANFAFSPIHRALGLSELDVFVQDREKSLSSYRIEQVGKTHAVATYVAATDQHQFDADSIQAWLTERGGAS